MPIYEYECKNCGHRFEVIQKFSDKPVSQCENCGGQVIKVLAPPALMFKGTGWYVTDYSSKGKEAAAKEKGQMEKPKQEAKPASEKKTPEKPSPESKPSGK